MSLASYGIPDANNPDSFVKGEDLDSLADYLFKIANEIKDGKWPNAAAVTNGRYLKLVLEGVWER
jgi:hypothetical protein